MVTALLGHEHAEVACLGGRYNARTQAFSGPATIAAVSELRVRTLFLAASGMRPDGVYCGTDVEALTKRAMVNIADEVVLLADSSKFGVSAMVRACTLTDLDHLITDDGIPDQLRDELAARRVGVTVVPDPGRARPTAWPAGSRPPARNPG